MFGIVVITLGGRARRRRHPLDDLDNGRRGLMLAVCGAAGRALGSNPGRTLDGGAGSRRRAAARTTLRRAARATLGSCGGSLGHTAGRSASLSSNGGFDSCRLPAAARGRGRGSGRGLGGCRRARDQNASNPLGWNWFYSLRLVLVCESVGLSACEDKDMEFGSDLCSRPWSSRATLRV